MAKKKEESPVQRYVKLYRKVEKLKRIPPKDRKEDLEALRAKLDAIYMGELNVWDRAEVSKELDRNLEGIL